MKQFSDMLLERTSKNKLDRVATSEYENELSKALQDGVISTSERNKLTKIARDMNLSEEQIKTMEKKLKEVS